MHQKTIVTSLGELNKADCAQAHDKKVSEAIEACPADCAIAISHAAKTMPYHKEPRAEYVVLITFVTYVPLSGIIPLEGMKGAA